MRHKEKYREHNKRYYKENKQEFMRQCKEYRKRRHIEDPSTKIPDIMRHRIWNALNGSGKNTHTMDLLGCTIEFYKDYLQGKFTEGMTWDNYTYYGWHIDHIKPIALFDLSDPEQLKEAFHYTNTQPMWWYDNFKKGARYIG